MLDEMFPHQAHFCCISNTMNSLTLFFLLTVISLSCGFPFLDYDHTLETQMVYTACSKEQFKCENGKCINRSWRCDKEKDCTDNSDEEYCELDSTVNRRYLPRRNCPSHYFRCSDFHCIPNTWKCDGIKDCSDDKDENSCEPDYCGMPNIFKCTSGRCISKDLICNGIDDCKDKSDETNCFTGIFAIPEVNITKQTAVSWLKIQRNNRYGWNENTHRAIIALYLSGNVAFNGSNQEEELMTKELELQISLALLRNNTDPVTSSMLAAYINALLVTCHSPHNFYGFNLASILKKQIENNLNNTHPLVYLALCNANHTFSAEYVDFLLQILENKSEYPFWTDIQAGTVMALSCITKQSNYSYLSPNVSLATTNFKNQQHVDGSFGNVYTSALVIQALLANGHEEDTDWNLKTAINYLKSKQHLDGSFGDFLATYWIIPILNAKSLSSISHAHCGSLRRQQRGGGPDNDLKYRLGPKIYCQYSLYIGNEMDIVHSMSLRIPVNITVYNVMQLASQADHKYKFESRKSLDKMYVYSVSDIANDPETGMFWLLYLSNVHSNGTASLSVESPDKLIVESGEHIIMWYKLANIR